MFTTRTNVEATIPEEIAKEVLKMAASRSAALQMFRNVKMSSKVFRQPVLSALATAGFVNGDTGLKTLSKIGFEGRFLYAEPIAVILPIAEDVVADSGDDLMAELEKEGGAAIARALDGACFFGIGKPQTWQDGIAVTAQARGNSYVRGTNAVNKGGIAEDINQLLGLVEDDGYDPNAIMARRAFRKYVRGARDLNGQKLLETGVNGDLIEGLNVNYLSGVWASGPNTPEVVLGDKDMAILGVRSDITLKILDQATLQQEDGTLIHLAQQDMVAVRLVARYGFAVADPVTVDNQSANRFPFAVLNSPGVPAGV